MHTVAMLDITTGNNAQNHKEKSTMSNETTNTNSSTTNAVAKAPAMQLAVPEETIAALDTAAANGVLAQTMASQFKRMFMTGACMQQLRSLLTPKVMQPIMALQNSPVGFLTDRPGGYDVATVTNCVIEAAMQGVAVVGNEFNILAGRCYITKNGMKHKLRDITGLYKNVTPGIPKACGESGAIERMHIEWTINNTSKEKDIDFAIRVNRGMGADAIIGKATRKALAWLYEEVTGNTVPEGEVGDVVVMDTTVEESPLEKQPEQVQQQTAQHHSRSNDELPM